MSTHYSLVEFESLYEAIQSQNQHRIDQLVEELAKDLKDLNCTYPRKNENSRKQLEKGRITLVNEGEFTVNESFIVSAVQLSNDLNIDELVAAEFIYHASNDINLGTSVVDSAKANFFLRRQNILSIVSYLLNAGESSKNVEIVSSVENFFKSLEAVESELAEIKNLIKRAKLLDFHNSIYFKQDVKFRRDFLFREHEILSEIFLGFVNRQLVNKDHFIKAYHLLEKYDADDLFVIHLLPGMVQFCSSIANIRDSDVKSIYDLLVKKELADTDKISSKPTKLLVISIFITYFINWCGLAPERSAEFEFESSCSDPMSTCISLGAMEQLMSVAADTTGLDSNAQLFYDFRSLLQPYLPKLLAKQVCDIDEEATIQLKRKLQQENLLSNLDDELTNAIYMQDTSAANSDHFISLFVPILVSYVETFIATSAFMLNKLRDSEEDSLLASDKFDLDDVSKKADLERFYLSIYYLYSNRPSLAARFWDKSSPLFGFIKWASSSNSALMRSTFCVMLSALSSSDRNAIETYNFLQSNSTVVPTSSAFALRNSTSNISWSTIYEDLAYYNKALSEPSHEDTYQNQLQLYGKPQESIAGKAELGEDSVLYISGYFQLISAVAHNNDQTRKELFESDDLELPNILKSFLSNDTQLTGTCLLTLKSLISGDEAVKKKVWEIVENWIFGQAKARQYISKDGSKMNIKKIFAQSLKSFDDILGFITLLHDLLTCTAEQPYEQYSLSYPAGLGLETGRKQGIYPYFEFMIEEVFSSTTQPFLTSEERLKLQKPLLSLISSVLHSVDEKNMIEYAQYCHLSKMSNLFKSPLDFQSYVQAEPSSAAMNYMFNEKAYGALFDIISIGVDEIADKPAHFPQIETLTFALSIVDRILNLQSYFIETAIPTIKNLDHALFVPANFGTHGLRSFYDAILFRLPIVAHLALYVGSQHTEVAQLSLNILTKVNQSPRFNENNNAINDRGVLLTTFQTIDESERIKSAFIDQLSSEITSDEVLTLKLKIMKFLDTNLSTARHGPTISHFLLGFEFKGDHLITGDVKSERSLLKTIVFVLTSSIDGLSADGDIRHAPAKLAALALKIIVKLCKNSVSRHIVMPLLRHLPEGNLFMKLLSYGCNLDASMTTFEGLKFNSVLSIQNTFTAHSQAIGALISFISFRKLISQYLALEIIEISNGGSLSTHNLYINTLIDGNEILNGAPKITGFLDIMQFNFTKFIEPFDMAHFGEFDYDFIIKNIQAKDTDLLQSNLPIYDLSTLEKMVKLNSIEYLATRLSASSDKNNALTGIEKESNNIKSYLTNYCAFNDFKTAQLSSLKAWSLLVQAVITQGRLDDSSKARLILEIFQTILPKINDYIDQDINLAEELVSLCVLLYDEYDGIAAESSVYHVLFPVFQTCISGLMSTRSSAELRSDFYILATKYLRHIATSGEKAQEALNLLDLDNNENFAKTVFNDSILGDSSARVTSVVFLEKLLKLSSKYNEAIANSLLRNDYLALLVSSIKKTDEMLSSCFASTGSPATLSLYGMLYELTAFKTTLYFLIRIAETRTGASKLIQSDVFGVIKSCSMLKIDPDLGVDLNFAEFNNHGQTTVSTNLSLDTPLKLPDEFHADANDVKSATTSVSLFEIFVPLFQLLSAVTISMGPSNDPIRTKNKDLLKQAERLVVGILKRDAIMETKANIINKESSNVYHNDASLAGLKELAKQFTLLYSLAQ